MQFSLATLLKPYQTTSIPPRVMCSKKANTDSNTHILSNVTFLSNATVALTFFSSRVMIVWQLDTSAVTGAAGVEGYVYTSMQ